jgi:RNA polymerase sigma-70 factor (sigma-E family)
VPRTGPHTGPDPGPDPGPEPSAEETFTAWAAARQHALLRTAYLLTGDLHRAEDLLQDALTKVAQRWRRLQAGNPEGYARTILVRTNVSWWRSFRREHVVGELPDVDRSGPADPDAVERRVVVARALAKLPPRQRAVLVLRYYDDLTERQTADVLGVSVGTVKSQAHAALQKLRAESAELAELIGSSQENGMSS